MGFFKKYFEDTSYEFSHFYMILFIMFFGVFILYLITTLLKNKEKEEKLKNIPFED